MGDESAAPGPASTGAEVNNGWQGRSVLLTGHTGFKGSWLSLWLAALRAEVTGLSDSVPEPNPLFESLRLEQDLAGDRRGDVRELETLRAAIDACEPSVVFHLAAQPLVRASYRAPVETFDANAGGTVRLLEAVRECDSVEAVVIVTTDKCYENREWPWGYREHEPMGGADPYSASKACAELMTHAYRRSYFSDEGTAEVASARAGNVIGGGDHSADRLVPDAIKALRAGQTLEVRNPDAIRPWQHVLAPLQGYLMLAEALLGRPGFDRAWNFGPAAEDARPVRWLADTLVGGEPGRWQSTASATDPHEASVLRLDSALARERLGWIPAWAADQAAARTLAWYEAEERGEDMRAFSIEQLDAYRKATTGGNQE